MTGIDVIKMWTARVILFGVSLFTAAALIGGCIDIVRVLREHSLTDIWYSTFYSRTRGIKLAIVSTEPHDCDFFAAPIGSKSCHYTKEVTEGNGLIYVMWRRVSE